MRLAILSDIHGNPLALDAVLADIQSQGEVDAHWVLGDFAALGYYPVAPLEKVTALSLYALTFQQGSEQITGGKNPAASRRIFVVHNLICGSFQTRSGSSRMLKLEPVTRKKQGNFVPLARQLPLPIFGAIG